MLVHCEFLPFDFYRRLPRTDESSQLMASLRPDKFSATVRS
jgi:hypothetical protein